VRRPLAGGAFIAALVIACIGAGCGSGSGDSGKHAATNSATTAAARAAQHARNSPDPLAALGAGRHTKRQRELVALLKRNSLRPGSHPRSPTRAQVIAAAIAAHANATAHPTSPADKTCRLPLGGRTIPVACGLRSQLLAEARHNKTLARLLAHARRSR
jgi:hypothetical protein